MNMHLKKNQNSYIFFLNQQIIYKVYLVFVQNLMYLIFGIYTIYINKLGHTEKTNSEGVIAAGVLTILSAILTYGLADKIYI